MPDRRKRRGASPKDRACFAPESIPSLQRAVTELSWLRTRGYSDKASLTLVGDRYRLRDRQRKALQRCAAADEQIMGRERRRIEDEDLSGETVVIDGYNVILSLETALCGGVLLLARDGVLRDLAAMSRHYRRVDATRAAIDLMGDSLDQYRCANVHLFLDRPVSNSGRLRKLILESVEDRSASWQVDLTNKTDQLLIDSPHIVATADSAILDRCSRWFNLCRSIVERRIPSAWIVDLATSDSVKQSTLP